MRQLRIHVVGIRGPGEIDQMARIAGGGQSGITTAGVALNASRIEVSAGQRKRRGGMVVRGRSPIRRRVTGLTRGREAGRGMTRVVGGRVQRVMTRIAGAGRSAAVLPVGVALLTIGREMRAGQREYRARMIEGGRLPRGGVVAYGAVVRERSGHMIGTRRRGEARGVAGVTGGRKILILSVRMALRAGDSGMCPGQRKAGGGMIERRIPIGGRMAGLARRGEDRGHVVWILRS
jgi:hypothetical protein